MRELLFESEMNVSAGGEFEIRTGGEDGNSTEFHLCFPDGGQFPDTRWEKIGDKLVLTIVGNFEFGDFVTAMSKFIAQNPGRIWGV